MDIEREGLPRPPLLRGEAGPGRGGEPMLLRLLTLLQKLSMEVLSPLLEALVFPLGLERATRPLPSLYFAAAGAVSAGAA